MTPKKRKPEQPDAQIVQGHVLDVLAGMEAESVSCVVTSPPYWSLRKYDAPDVTWPDGFVGQYGLEPTPELYVEHTLDVLRAIRRVLRPDGVVWWNIGDGYVSSPAKGGSGPGAKETGNQYGRPFRPGAGRADGVVDQRAQRNRDGISADIPAKNLVLMPSRVALAAQADGWWVRSVVIWNKPNCMPESCKDRPTTSHEYVLFLTKSAHYFYDSEAVREAPSADSHGGGVPVADYVQRATGQPSGWGVAKPAGPAGRNLRSVWTFPTAQTPEAHFATFPEELPRRCILASAPQAICSKCGVARVRVVERVTESVPQRQGGDGNWAKDEYGRAGGFYDGEQRTTGWTDCECSEPDYQPGVVLDCFAGVGTTGVVAQRLGRRFVGIELSQKYCRMAAKRMEQTTLGIPL